MVGLRAGAGTVRDTTALLAEGRVRPPEDLGRPLALFDHAYVQFRTEPAGAPGPDWLVLLTVVHRIDDYATVLHDRHAAGPLPPPDAAAALTAAAAEVVAAYLAAADALAAGGLPATGTGSALTRRLAVAVGRDTRGPSLHRPACSSRGDARLPRRSRWRPRARRARQCDLTPWKRLVVSTGGSN